MGKLNTTMVTSILLIVVMLIMVFTALADTADDVGEAAGNLTCTRYNSTGGVVNAGCVTNAGDTYPLTGFFKRKGLVLLSFMAGVAIVIITAVLNLKHK